jgi:hypothetical protein
MKFAPSPTLAVAPADQEHKAAIESALGVGGQSIRLGRSLKQSRQAGTHFPRRETARPFDGSPPNMEFFTMKLTDEELITAARAITGDDIKSMTLDDLHRVMTVTQYVTDTILNEIEARDELTFLEGYPIVPYQADLMVETILTRS